MSTEPQVIQCANDCVVTVVHEFAIPLLSLSTEDATLISSAVLLVLATGWAFRVLIRVLNTTDGDSTLKGD